MKPTDDVWKDISSLSSPITNSFPNFFPPSLRPPETTTMFFPPTPPLATNNMLTLLTPTSDTLNENPNKRQKPNPPQPLLYTSRETSPPEHSEKFRRLMKNRESAARSRARKQARADELEQEVMRLAKENAKLKRLQKEACVSQLQKKSRLHRTKSAPF
ncbi:bZIP transcription factor FD [Artemisia annua]|uniref:FD n=1 Tax=Artemisia annua TaxID=35608 RepID=A0A2P1JMN8_ARTAN|nr:FD [Artemisia annua]PWA62639.1 bZIP transcription factor FD [Artemisia annua]